MTDQDEIAAIFELSAIAKELHHLLREDSMHRLRLTQEYSMDPNTLKWTPDLVRRALLADTLSKKLDSLIYKKEISKLKKAS